MTSSFIDASKPIVLVPAYNESHAIGKVMSDLAQLRTQGVIGHIIVVDDGSKDSTGKRALLRGADVVLMHEKNAGKAMGFFTGIKHIFENINPTQVNSARVVLLDGDLKGITAKQIHALTSPLGQTTTKRNQLGTRVGMVVGTVGNGTMDQSLSGQRAFRLIDLKPILTRPALQRRLLGSTEYRRGYGLETFLNYFFTRKRDILTEQEINKSKTDVGQLRRAILVPTKIKAGIGTHYKERLGRDDSERKRFIEEIYGSEIIFEDRNKYAQELAKKRKLDLSLTPLERKKSLAQRMRERLARREALHDAIRSTALVPKVTIARRKR